MNRRRRGRWGIGVLVPIQSAVGLLKVRLNFFKLYIDFPEIMADIIDSELVATHQGPSEREGNGPLYPLHD